MLFLSMRFPFFGRRMINPHLQSLGTLSLSEIYKSNSYYTATVVSRSAFISSVVMPLTPPAFPFFICFIAVLISGCVTGPVSISSGSQASLSSSDRMGGGLFRTLAKCSFHLSFTCSSFVSRMPSLLLTESVLPVGLLQSCLVASNTTFTLPVFAAFSALLAIWSIQFLLSLLSCFLLLCL